MTPSDLKRRNALALKYFTGAVLLFVVGYSGGWLADQSFVKDLVGKSSPAPESKKTVNSSAPPEGDSQEKASQKPGREYTVQPGDTISGIAGANGISFEELAQYNNIPYPYSLTVGQVIIIPGK